MLIKNTVDSSVEGRFWLQQLCVRAGGGGGSRDALVSGQGSCASHQTRAGVMFSEARLLLQHHTLVTAETAGSVLLQDSQNPRIVGIGKDLWRSFSSLSEEAHVEQLSQECVQVGLECL